MKSLEDEFYEKFTFQGIWSIYGEHPKEVLSWFQSKLAEQKVRHVEIVKNFRLKTSRNVELSGALREYLRDNQKEIIKAIEQDGGSDG